MYIGWRVKHIRNVFYIYKNKKTISWWVNLFVYTEKNYEFKMNISQAELFIIYIEQVSVYTVKKTAAFKNYK